MSWLAELLPLCFVRWYANKYCERYERGGDLFTMPRLGVHIHVKDYTDKEKERKYLGELCRRAMFPKRKDTP